MSLGLLGTARGEGIAEERLKFWYICLPSTCHLRRTHASGPLHARRRAQTTQPCKPLRPQPRREQPGVGARTRTPG